MSDAPHATVVSARQQTAGRGQRGNSWESEPGKNLTLSILLRPQHIDTHVPFVLSAAVALGVHDTVASLLNNFSDREVSIKWPNDIYIADSKVAGILIENSLDGHRLRHSIIGIGLNVNQLSFISDAPNPISIANVTGREYQLDKVEEMMCRAVIESFEKADNPAFFDATMTRYNSLLYRRQSLHYYREPDGKTFLATSQGVDSMGRLTLTDTYGVNHTYNFKEVAHVI